MSPSNGRSRCLLHVNRTTSLPPLVSVVVVNWNRRELLRACLRSLARQAYRDFEVLVVDNGSNDGSPALAQDTEFQDGHYWICNAENQGFCAANNQAIRQAQGKYVALLNNDAEADPGWLEALVATLERNQQIGMAASKVLFHGNRSVIDKVGHVIYPDGQNRGRGSGEHDRGQYDQPEEVAWPDGCAALYRKQLLDEIGGFDEDFFAYGDDAELGLRARIAGWLCLSVPEARVYHRLGATLGRHSERRAFLIERNRMWLAAKLFPWRLLWLNPFYFALRAAATAAAAIRGCGEGERWVASLGPYRLLRCLVKGHIAGWRGVPAMLRKRRQVRSLQRLSSASLTASLELFDFGPKRLGVRVSPSRIRGSFCCQAKSSSRNQ